MGLVGKLQLKQQEIGMKTDASSKYVTMPVDSCILQIRFLFPKV